MSTVSSPSNLRRHLWPLVLAAALPLGCPDDTTATDDEVGGGGLLPGDLVITEMMVDPEGADAGQEWFEIYNNRGSAIELQGVELVYAKADGTGRKTHAISRSTMIEPGDYLVVGGVLDEIAAQSDTDLVDYGYAGELGDFTNAGGYLAIEVDDVIIDDVYYEQASSGASRAFDGAFAPDFVANDDTSKWCDTRTEYEGPTLLATPGAANDLCSQVGCLENGMPRELMPAGPGDFVITELHANPDVVDDALGEWFELHALNSFDLNGLEIGKIVGDPAEETILDPNCLAVAQGEYVVIARSLDPLLNGGIPAEAIRYQMGTSLKNTDGSLWMGQPGEPSTVIDAITWKTAPTGATTQLDPDYEDPTSNDDLGYWCTAAAAFGAGDLGSPGAMNEECAIEPPEGMCFDPDTNELRPLATIAMGDLVITELIANPEGVADGDGEWFELAALASGDLNGLRIGKAGAWEDKPIEWIGETGICVEVNAGDYVVVAHDADPLINCGLPVVDGLFDMALNNSNSNLMIGFEVAPNQIEIWDEVSWTSTPAGSSSSFGLPPDVILNDDPANWCAGVGVYGCGDQGTPDQANPACGGGGGGLCIDPDTNMARVPVAPAMGDVQLTEVMPDPSLATDAVGEWFEIHTNAAFDLNGLEIGKNGAVADTVEHPMNLCIEVPADAWLAFAVASDDPLNCLDGVTLVDYDGLSLTNDPGNMFVGHGGQVLDEFAWPSSPTGASLSLDLESNTWCAAVDPYGCGDLGTPALPNPDCGGGMMGGQCLDAGVPRDPVVPGIGDLIIDEVMSNPNAVSDALGEWFELRALANVDLNGLELGNAAFMQGAPADLTLSSADCLAVTAGETVLFARNADPLMNGGLPPVDFTFGFGLTNSNAFLYIGHQDALLDQVDWATSAAGASTSLDPDFYDPLVNDNADNADPAWCYQTTVYGLGDKGTPDAANGQCP